MAVTSSIPADVWSIVGGNPVPGEPDGIVAKARVYRGIADNAGHCRTELKRLTSRNTTWKGDAADAFRSELEESAALPKDLLKLHDSYAAASSALQRYGDRLRDLQDQAVREAGAGRQANDDEGVRLRQVQSRESQIEHYRRSISNQSNYLQQLRRAMADPAYLDRTNPANAEFARQVDERYRNGQNESNQLTSSLQTAQSQCNSERSSLEDARNRLRQARDRIRDIGDERNRLVDETVDAIEDASDLGIKNKKWWQKAVDWVKENWVDALDWLSKQLDKIGMVLAIVTIIVAIAVAPFTGGASLLAALAILSLGVAVTKFAVDAVLLSQGRRTWGDLAWSAADVVLSAFAAAKAVKLAKAAKAAKALKSTGTVVKAAKAAGPGFIKRNANKILNQPMVKKFQHVRRVYKQVMAWPQKHITRKILHIPGVQRATDKIDDVFRHFTHVPGKKYVKPMVEKAVEKVIVPPIAERLPTPYNITKNYFEQMLSPKESVQTRYQGCYGPPTMTTTTVPTGGMVTSGSGGGGGGSW